MCMDWDHLDSSTKSFNISQAVTQLYTKEKIHEEIAKCELVCANCHRLRTEARRTGVTMEHLATAVRTYMVNKSLSEDDLLPLKFFKDNDIGWWGI